jgi:hypothetical protein
MITARSDLPRRVEKKSCTLGSVTLSAAPLNDEGLSEPSFEAVKKNAPQLKKDS